MPFLQCSAPRFWRFDAAKIAPGFAEARLCSRTEKPAYRKLAFDCAEQRYALPKSPQISNQAVGTPAAFLIFVVRKSPKSPHIANQAVGTPAAFAIFVVRKSPKSPHIANQSVGKIRNGNAPENPPPKDFRERFRDFGGSKIGRAHV